MSVQKSAAAWCARLVVVALATVAVLPAQWTARSPATRPGPRFGAAMEFVPQNQGAILFGGSAPLLDGQTWLFDGTDWTLLAPAVSPSPRTGAQLVFDQQRGVAVLYGGLASNLGTASPTSETWEWDGLTWTQAAPTSHAGARYRYGACHDPLRGRVVMYGGFSTQQIGPPNNQTWEYDGTTWLQVATTGNPPAVDRPAMCFDLVHGKAVLFGGATGAGVIDQTWLYDGAAATWTQVATSGPRPAARNAAKMVYDREHQVCVLTGGQDSSGPSGDTWTFDGATWQQLTTSTTTPMRDHSLAFFDTTARTVRFGGVVATPSTLTDETWDLATAAFGSGCPGSGGVPRLMPNGATVAGQSWSLELTNLDPTLNLCFLVFGLTRTQSMDLGLIGMPGCAAITTPDVLLAVAGAAGAATWTWPAVAPQLGASFYCEALCFDPAANQLGFTASNGVYATIVD